VSLLLREVAVVQVLFYNLERLPKDLSNQIFEILVPFQQDLERFFVIHRHNEPKKKH